MEEEKVSINPVEVVIRNAKYTQRELKIKVIATALATLIRTLLVMWLVPPVSSMFSLDLHPNFGLSLLVVLLVNTLTRGSRVDTLLPHHENGYLKK